MSEQETIYDPAVADNRFQLEVLGVRWALVGLYALFLSNPPGPRPDNNSPADRMGAEHVWGS